MNDPLLNPSKLIINVALTGIVPTKAQNPNVPISPEEIIADAKRCRDAGASIIHIHARDKSGNPAYDSQIYQDIVQEIRSFDSDLIVCVTTSGRVFRDIEHRSACLASNPDMASLTLGSMNFPDQASINEPETIKGLAIKMRDHRPTRIVPEMEFFEPGMINFAKYLITKGILIPPFYCNILLGSLGTANATPYTLVSMVQELPNQTVWSATGIGRYQAFVENLAIAMGGHVRTGLEDNLFYDVAKHCPASNPGLVDRVVQAATGMGRGIATPAEARAVIGLTSY